MLRLYFILSPHDKFMNKSPEAYSPLEADKELELIAQDA